MRLPSTRILFLIAFLGSAALLGVAYYLEHFEGLNPCPLCLVQRAEVALFGLVCLVAALHGPKPLGQRIYAFFALFFAGTGIASAGRQIWLQGLPEDQLPSCLPPLDFLLQTNPLIEVIKKMMSGTADCAEVTWSLFGLNLAELSMISFVIMALYSLFILFRPRPKARF